MVMEVKQRDDDIVMTFQVKAWINQVLCGMVQSSIPCGISAEGSDEDVFEHKDEDEHDKEHEEEDDEEEDEDKA